MAEGDIPAYQRFLNADSSIDSKQYSAGRKALQVIKDTIYDADSRIAGMIGRQEYKEAVSFLIGSETEVNTSEWDSKIKLLESWITSDDTGIQNFWLDLKLKGFIENGQLSGTVEDMEKAFDTNYDVIVMMLEQTNQYMSEPIILTQE